MSYVSYIRRNVVRFTTKRERGTFPKRLSDPRTSCGFVVIIRVRAVHSGLNSVCQGVTHRGDQGRILPRLS